jgi:hypothetical protein
MPESLAVATTEQLWEAQVSKVLGRVIRAKFTETAAGATAESQPSTPVGEVAVGTPGPSVGSVTTASTLLEDERHLKELGQSVVSEMNDSVPADGANIEDGEDEDELLSDMEDDFQLVMHKKSRKAGGFKGANIKAGGTGPNKGAGQRGPIRQPGQPQQRAGMVPGRRYDRVGGTPTKKH